MNKLSLYLHFPFCKAKCCYCDFYSLPDLSLSALYEAALCKNLSFFAKEAEKFTVDTVYFGGGTPSLFSIEGVKSVFSSIREHYNIASDAEITVEMNPESAGEGILSAFREAGCNRVSFGMQSACEEELSALGRLHRFEDVKEAVKRAVGIGFDNISLDLMYGLPAQTLSLFRESLERALSLEPKHLSFYLLTLSPQVPMYARKDTLPDDEAVREMYLFASDFLKEKGFEHYEISNAALSGYRSRHNEVYWTGGDYLGIGPGAHSFFGGERFFVKDGIREFILASNPLDRISSREKLTPSDRLTEYVMLSLRRKEGISLKSLSALADEEFCRKTEKKMTLWSSHGLCVRTDSGFALTPKGFFVSNEMISELI